jgi:hypothetical protein
MTVRVGFGRGRRGEEWNWAEGEGSVDDRVGRVIGRRGAWGVGVSALWAGGFATARPETRDQRRKNAADITKERGEADGKGHLGWGWE